MILSWSADINDDSVPCGSRQRKGSADVDGRSAEEVKNGSGIDDDMIDGLVDELVLMTKLNYEYTHYTLKVSNIIDEKTCKTPQTPRLQ